MRRRVVVLTRDLVPMPGLPASGGGLRAWGLGEALRGRGHEVIYSLPRGAVPRGEVFEDLRRASFELGDLQRTLLRLEPDVILVEQWGLATYLQDVPVPLVIDLHGSLILENAFRRHRSFVSNAAAKIKALRKADLVICPGYRQRAYFMSWMMMSGAEPTTIPIEVVPVCMPPELPEHRGSSEGPLTLVHGGQLWPWVHPELALKATAEVLAETGAGTCELFIDAPEQANLLPHDASSEVTFHTLPREITDHPTMKMMGRVDREQMLSRYAGADLAVDVYAWNPERELAYTTRTVEYMWCGLPVVYADYGELAGLIREYQAGWLVPFKDEGAIRDALRAAVTDRAELRRRGQNARRLVRERLGWDAAIRPVEWFFSDPVIRDKGQTMFGKLALEFDRIDGEQRGRIAELEVQLGAGDQELSERDGRIRELSAALADKDRQLTEFLDRYGREADQWERERDRLEERCTELRRRLDAPEAHDHDGPGHGPVSSAAAAEEADEKVSSAAAAEEADEKDSKQTP